MMSIGLGVAVGSAAGAPTRYALDRFIQSRHQRVFPWGTFFVNQTGSFALGLLVGLATRQAMDTTVVLAVGTGFLGAYTTFSTFVWETLALVEDGAFLAATLNMLASITAGLTAAGLGLLLGTMNS